MGNKDSKVKVRIVAGDGPVIPAEKVDAVFDACGIKAHTAEVVYSYSYTRYIGRILSDKTPADSDIKALEGELGKTFGDPAVLNVDEDGRFRLDLGHAGTSTISFVEARKELHKSVSELPVALGAIVGGEALISDLYESPHILIAGDDGYGKTNMLKVFLASIMTRRISRDVRFIVADLNDGAFDSIGEIGDYLQRPVIHDIRELKDVFEYLTIELERRYMALAEWGVRNIVEFNDAASSLNMPFLVLVVDGVEKIVGTKRNMNMLERYLKKIAAKARAAGIHLVFATSFVPFSYTFDISFPTKIVFRMEDENISQLIIESDHACRLQHPGDAILARNFMNGKPRLQTYEYKE